MTIYKVGIKLVKSSDIIFFRGNYAQYKLTVKRNSSAYDLSSPVSLALYVKRKVTEADGDAVITKTTGSGISAGDATGIVTITFDETDTEELEIGFNFVYDIELTTASGKLITILRGVFKLRQD